MMAYFCFFARCSQRAKSHSKLREYFSKAKQRHSQKRQQQQKKLVRTQEKNILSKQLAEFLWSHGALGDKLCWSFLILITRRGSKGEITLKITRIFFKSKGKKQQQNSNSNKQFGKNPSEKRLVKTAVPVEPRGCWRQALLESSHPHHQAWLMASNRAPFWSETTRMHSPRSFTALKRL